MKRTFFASLLCLTSLAVSSLSAVDLTESYDWKPVRIGAGGFVTGIVLHPQDPSVRYCRTDVGNAYRWDDQAKEWMPMLVHDRNSGVPLSAAAAPGKAGVEAIALDARDKKVVLIAFPVKYSANSKLPRLPGSIFRSTDGGRSFVQSDLNVKMDPNGKSRHKGEPLAIDPNNSKAVFFGSRENGLWKSTDGGLKWTQLTQGGAPAANANVIGVRFDPVNEKQSVVYAIVQGGAVLQSVDGGSNWTDVSVGAGIAGSPLNSTIDKQGNLYIAKAGGTKFWKRTRAGEWTELSPNFGSSGNQANCIAADPANPLRLFAIGTGGSISRSLDGGRTWIPLGNTLHFAGTLGWLPQQVKGSSKSWRSNGGIYFDASSRLWIPQGNEGVLTCSLSKDNVETAANPPLWTIDSKGIEEFVTHDVIIPANSGDQAIGAVEDGTAFLIKDPDSFTAVQAGLQEQLISNCTGLAWCPNDGKYIAAVTADVHHTGSGADYSGYSLDGGQTWQQFASRPPGAKAGSIAISRRGSWTAGDDHLVWYPLHSQPPSWSFDGGKTWNPAKGFTVKPNGAMNDITGFWNGALKQRALIADPHTPDRYFLYTVYGGPARLYRSDDGGQSWNPLPESGLPNAAHHAQLIANPFVKDEYWFADGWESGGKIGLWRSNDGLTFTQVPGIEHAITLAAGKGTTDTGAIYLYGKVTGEPEWGVFRTVDSGKSWDRISRYPMGNYDFPTCMAASMDTFGLVYIGLSGNSFVYGRPR